jgi:chemotaxis protein CheD
VRAIPVGVGDCRVSDDLDCELVTYALGSCIAVAIYDPEVRVAGLLHFMLPNSTLSPAKAHENPFMFADTGIPLLFRRTYEYGAERRRIIVRVAGGAQVLQSEGNFNIGKRNYLEMRKILSNAGLLVHGEAVGGTVSRTIRLEVATGRLRLRTECSTQSPSRVSGPSEYDT